MSQPPSQPADPDADFRERLRTQLLTLRMVWMAMIQTSVLYAGVLWFVTHETAPTPAAEAGPVLAALVLGGLAVSAASYVVRPLLLGGRRIGMALSSGGDAAAMGAVTSGFIVTWAVADAAAVAGLVVGILTARPLPSYGLIAGGAAFIIAHAPAQRTIAAIFDDAQREIDRGGAT